MWRFCLILLAWLLMGLNDSHAQSEFEVYRPSGFEKTQPLPIVIFFDPAARGALPISLYKSLADRYGIVMAGSNVSKNRSLNDSKASFAQMINALVEDYAIDSKRIILCGFSGGGRAAYSIARDNPFVAAVISCGAGIIGDFDKDLMKRSVYVGISGIHDMNFSEQYFLQRRIVQSGGQSRFIVTCDDHRWPRPVHMQEALRAALGLEEEPIDVTQFEDSVIVTKIAAGRLFEAKLHASNVGQGKLLARFDIEQEQMDKDSAAFLKSLYADESYLKQFFSDAQRSLLPMGRDMLVNGYWNTKAREVKVRMNSKDPYTKTSGGRQYDLTWRYCAEFFLPIMEQGNYEGAIALATIWNTFDSDSAIPWVMRAKAMAAREEKKQSLRMLMKAIGAGFANKENLIQDPYLKKVFTREEIESLFQ